MKENRTSIDRWLTCKWLSILIQFQLLCVMNNFTSFAFCLCEWKFYRCFAAKSVNMKRHLSVQDRSCQWFQTIMCSKFPSFIFHVAQKCKRGYAARKIAFQKKFEFSCLKAIVCVTPNVFYCYECIK